VPGSAAVTLTLVLIVTDLSLCVDIVFHRKTSTDVSPRLKRYNVYFSMSMVLLQLVYIYVSCYGQREEEAGYKFLVD
jgi:hypothetical protein